MKQQDDSLKRADKKCTRCRQKGRRATWRCRDCGAYCCQHLCGFKTMDGTATCGKCNLLSAR